MRRGGRMSSLILLPLKRCANTAMHARQQRWPHALQSAQTMRMHAQLSAMGEEPMLRTGAPTRCEERHDDTTTTTGRHD